MTSGPNQRAVPPSSQPGFLSAAGRRAAAAAAAAAATTTPAAPGTPTPGGPGGHVKQAVTRASLLGDPQVTLSLHAVGLESAMFTDVQFLAFNETFPLHRVVLCTNPYFRSLLFENMWAEEEEETMVGRQSQSQQQIQLNLEDPWITRTAFQTILARIYGKLDTTDVLTEENVLALLAAAFFFADGPLAEACVAYITAHLSQSNVVRYLNFGESSAYGKYSLQLLEECFSYFCSLGCTLDPGVFTQLSWRWVPKILAADCFYVPSENERYQFIKRAIQERRRGGGGKEPAIPSPTSTTPRPEKGGAGSKRQRMGHGDGNHHHSQPQQQKQHGNHESGGTPTSAAPAYDAGDNEEDIEFITNLFYHSVFYSQIPFEELSQISQDNLVDMSVLSEALWKRCELQRRITTAPDEPYLGLASNPGNRRKTTMLLPFLTPSIGAGAGKDGAIVPFKAEDEKLLSVLCAPIYPHFNSVYKPLRFAAEFRDISNLGRGSSSRKSKPMFYAGSHWQIWIDKIGEEHPQLGIYLKRLEIKDPLGPLPVSAAGAEAAEPGAPAAAPLVEGSADGSNNTSNNKRAHPGDSMPLAATSSMQQLTAPGAPGVPEFIDRRITIKTKFRLFCFVGRKCIIRNFKPADFKPQCASWGWTDDEGLFEAACAEGSLRVCVVLENV